MVLNRRILREFKGNISKYLGLIMLVLIGSMLIVGFSNSTDCVMTTGQEAALKNNLEDGEFNVEEQLSNMTLEKIRSLGADIEENFYVDYKLYENVTIRLFKERKNINRISINQGDNLTGSNQIVLDEHFAVTNKYKLSSSLEINNKQFKVVGYGAAPDYTNVIKKSSDVSAPSFKNFGIAFISEDDFIELKDKCYSYVFKLNGASPDKIKNMVSESYTMTSFVKTEDNLRATGYIYDSKVNKNVAIIMGFVLCIMIGFMISVSLVNSINEQSPIIGALYALGYIKKEILRHFMILPLIIVSIGAVTGTGIGFAIEGLLAQTITGTYELPNIKRVYSAYLFLVGIAMPVIVVLVINYIIISKKLNSTPLQLLRREKKASKLNTIKINHFGFINKFRLREFLREIRGNIVLFFGLFLSTFLLVFGVCINAAINGYIDDIKKESSYEYMYTLKLPIKVKEDDTTERATFQSVFIYFKGLAMDKEITLQGIKQDTKFYPFNIKDNDPGLYISDSVKNKFNLNEGDTITLKDKIGGRFYNLKIKGIINYKTGLNVFMNQKQLNELMKEDKTYFNGYLSTKELDINDDYIYNKTTFKSIVKSAQNTMSMMRSIIILLIVCSTILFVISMYLLLKLMIDKSIISISLIRIFGFNSREINKLYLGSSLYTVIFSEIVSIPITIQLSKMIYPSLIASLQAYFAINLKLSHYGFIIGVICVSYFMGNTLLKRYINSISLTEALKNRD